MFLAVLEDLFFTKNSSYDFMIFCAVHAQKKLVQGYQFVCMLLSAQAVAPTYLELQMSHLG